MVSILIPVRNEAGNIGRCLKAVFSQEFESNYEVVIVDSGSTDGTLEEARAFPVRIFCIPPEEFHHAKTRNFAATLARGDYLVFLGGDAFPVTKTWLKRLVANFADPLVGAVYGRHIPKPGSELERQQALGTLYGESRIVKEPRTKASLGYRYYQFSSVNRAIRKTVWEATRFPEAIKIGEDIGIAKCILDSGWKIVYEPEAPVYHSHDYRAGHLFKRYFDLGVVLCEFARKRTWRRLSNWALPSSRS